MTNSTGFRYCRFCKQEGKTVLADYEVSGGPSHPFAMAPDMDLCAEHAEFFIEDNKKYHDYRIKKLVDNILGFYHR